MAAFSLLHLGHGRRSGLGRRLLPCLALVSVLGLLLGAPATADAARFVFKGTHPQASLQPSATGRGLVTLQSWNGKLYSGFGDYGANTGPIAVTPFDGTRFASAPELSADTEAIYTFRVIDGKLYAPSIDTRVGSDYAVGTDIGRFASWSNPTVVGSTHAFDIVSLTGSDLWLVGSQGPDAAVWRSLDGGASWEKVLAVGPVSGIAGDFARFYGAGVYQSKLYVQARDFYGRRTQPPRSSTERAGRMGRASGRSTTRRSLPADWSTTGECTLDGPPTSSRPSTV